MNEKRPNLPALTGLRFVAAITIVLYHYARIAWTLPAAGSRGAIPLTFLHNLIIGTGAGGVELFFVLSGFILAYTYLRPDGSVLVNPGVFWIARIARIYPTYLLAWALAFAPLLMARVPGAVPASLLSLLWLQAWDAPLAFIGNGPAYTISIEALFYLLFPLTVGLLARCAINAPKRTVATLYGALWLGPLAASLSPDGSILREALIINPVGRLPEFLIGTVAGIWFVRRRLTITPPRHAPRSAGLAFVAWLGLCGVLPALPSWGAITLATGTVVPIFAVLIYALAWGRGSLAAALSVPWLVLLGKASYALYILQDPLWALLQRAMGLPFDAAMQSGPYVTFYVGILILTAILTLFTVEAPARKAMLHLYSRPLWRAPERASGQASSPA